MTIDSMTLYFQGHRADTLYMTESNTTERADMDYFAEGDFQHDAAVEDAMIEAARVPTTGDNRTEWQRQADEDWDYANDDDMGV